MFRVLDGKGEFVAAFAGKADAELFISSMLFYETAMQAPARNLSIEETALEVTKDEAMRLLWSIMSIWQNPDNKKLFRAKDTDGGSRNLLIELSAVMDDYFERYKKFASKEDLEALENPIRPENGGAPPDYGID